MKISLYTESGPRDYKVYDPGGEGGEGTEGDDSQVRSIQVVSRTRLMVTVVGLNF